MDDTKDLQNNIKNVEKLRQEFGELNSLFKLNNKRIRKIKEYKQEMKPRRDKALKKPTKYDRTNISVKPFNTDSFWLEQLIQNYTEDINSLNSLLTQQNKQMLHSKRNIPIQFLLDIETEVNSRKANDKLCPFCLESILNCKNHDNPAHRFEYINYDSISKLRLNENKVIAVDSECVTSKDKMIAIRIAAVTQKHEKQINKKINNNKIELLYHSFLTPDTHKFHSYKPITGIDRKEIQENLNKFVRRGIARKTFFEEIVKDNVVIFANAKSDIQSIGFPSFPDYRDIQEFYIRYPNRVQKESFKLTWLAKNVLRLKVNENAIHSPVTDASWTLRLYNLIPKEYWGSNCWNPIPNWFTPVPITTNMRPKSIVTSTKSKGYPKTKQKHKCFPSFSEDFEPDYEN